MLLDPPLLPVPLSTASRLAAWPRWLFFVKAGLENYSNVGMTGNRPEAWICAFSKPLFIVVICCLEMSESSLPVGDWNISTFKVKGSVLPICCIA